MRTIAAAMVTCLLCGFAVFGSTDTARAGPTATTPATIKVVCTPEGCSNVVTDPGKNKHSTKKTSKETTRKAGTSVCSANGRTVPCYDPTLGYFNNGDACYYKELQPHGPPPPGQKVGDGTWFLVTCLTMTGSTQYTAWRKTTDPPPIGRTITTVRVTPGQLAKKALAGLKFPHPTTGRGPGGTLQDGRPYTLVRAYTWFWTDPTTYKALSTRAAAGPVWARVVVTPSALTFTPGDGAQAVSCAGPGTAWASGRNSAWSPSPGGCDYSYPKSTYGSASGELTATYGITWKASWTGSGGAGGTFPDITTTAQSTFAVAEAEAVVTR